MTHLHQFPNLYLVGAMKAATTTVYQQLAADTRVFMSPIKEPKYFAFLRDSRRYHGPGDPDNDRYWVDRERYLGLFQEGYGRQLMGEASTLYLYHPDTATNMAETVPQARVVAILRDPAERAFSHFRFNRQIGREPEASFEEALRLEEPRIAAGWGSSWHYRGKSRYSSQLRRFMKVFPREQLHVAFYEDLRENPRSFFEALSSFLQLDPPLRASETAVFNKTTALRSYVLARILLRSRESLPPVLRIHAWRSRPVQLLRAALRPIYKLNTRPAEAAEPHLLDRLRCEFDEEITNLESLLGRDLTAWRSHESTP